MALAKQRYSEHTLQGLEDDLIAAVCKETGFQPSLARLVVMPIFAHLISRFPGERIYIAAPRRVYPVAEIVAAYAQTKNREAVCERFGLSRSKFYELVKCDSE